MKSIAPLTACFRLYALAAFAMALLSVAAGRMEFQRKSYPNAVDLPAIMDFSVISNWCYRLPGENLIAVARRTNAGGDNYGLYLFLYQKQNGTYRLRYRANPFARDSYILRPYFFRLNRELVILCELGAEESWGFQALLYDGNEMRKMGFMDVTSGRKQPANTGQSAIDDICVFKNGPVVEIRFTNDVFYTAPSNSPRLVKKDSIYFRYDGSNFTAVMKE